LFSKYKFVSKIFFEDIKEGKIISTVDEKTLSGAGMKNPFGGERIQ
jgi:hypothetical protein